MGRSKSSSRWLKEHFDDEYVLKAQQQGYRSRAVFKLDEIQKRDRIFRPGMRVVDLGAAPGAWCQYAVEQVGSSGVVVGLDILPMDGLTDVDFIQGDFREESVLNQLMDLLGGKKVDLVLSDMAPNMSGVDAVDQPGAMYLAELALLFAKDTLKPGGGLLTKVFQGEGFDELRKDTQSAFAKLLTRKPRASRARSREVYLLAQNFKL